MYCVRCPNLQADIDWEIEGKRLRDRIVTALGETILPDLENTITADFWMDPTDFRNKYRAQRMAPAFDLTYFQTIRLVPLQKPRPENS